MEEHLYSLLSGAVSFPVSWDEFPSDTGFPRVQLNVTGGTQDFIMSGPGTSQARVQVDCYGITAMSAIVAARQVLAAMNGYRGGPIQGIQLQTWFGRRPSDVQIVHQRTYVFLVSYLD